MIQEKNFIHNQQKKQFQLQLDSGLAIVDYEMRDNVMYLIHSEVPYDLRGKSIGNTLVEKTFEYIEHHNIQAVAICRFIKLVAQRSERWKNIIQ